MRDTYLSRIRRKHKINNSTKLLLQPQVNNQPLKQIGLALAHWQVRGDEVNQLLAHILGEVHDDGHSEAFAWDECDPVLCGLGGNTKRAKGVVRIGTLAYHHLGVAGAVVYQGSRPLQ